MSESVRTVFERSVDEGVERLERTTHGLLATGAVGGLDVSVGVFALLIVRHETGDPLLGAVAFGIGFVALTLANSELFTENFLVPVNAVVAKKAPWWSVLRLWGGTAAFNLVGGWVAMGLVMMAFPELRPTAVAVGSHAVKVGIGRQAFASAVIGGGVITLMTWMERSTTSVGAKLVSAWAIAFVLAAAPLQHAIVISIEAFGALHAGAAFGYADWARTFLWAALGNAVGGLGLVTTLRLLQLRGADLVAERERPKEAPRREGDQGDPGLTD